MGVRTNVADVDALRCLELSASPPTPAADHSSIFFRPDGLRTIDDSGVVNRMVEAPDGATRQTIIGAVDYSNVLIGDNVGSGGANNTFVGSYAGKTGSTGEYNSFFGFLSGHAITSGSDNVGVGTDALNDCTTGSDHVAVGSDCLTKVTTGNYNTSVGSESLRNCTGSNNVALGYQAGNQAVAVSGCVLLGYQAGYNNTTSNRLYVDNSNTASPLIYGEFDNDLLTINGILISASGNRENTTRKTTTYTATADDHIIFCDTDGGAWTLTLPAGIEGTNYKIINVGSSGNDLTIDGDGSETIWGAATFALTDGDIINLHFNAIEYWW